jgi:hypothetical protein
VVVNLPPEADANIELDAPRGRVIAQAEIHMAERSGDHVVGTLGAGGPKLEIESLRGDVIVRTGASTGPRPEGGERFRMHFAGMGERIAADVRRSVEESMRGKWQGPMHWDWCGEHVHRGHPKPWKHREREEREAQSASAVPEQAPRGPAPGSPERKAILDAIARGELSVDDAIRKLTGNET